MAVLIRIILVAIYSLLLTTAKEKYEIVEEKPNLEAVPHVGGYECVLCYYIDGPNRICVDHSIDITGGWQFIQTYSVDSTVNIYKYSIRVQPYVTASGTVHPQINIAKLYNNEITILFNQATANFFGEFLWWKDNLICVGAGWTTQAILV
jgi:hypothetical protein